MTWDLSGYREATQVGFLADDRVAFKSGDGAFIAEPDGSITTLPPYVDAVSTAAATGLLAVQTSANEDGSGCFEVIEAPGRHR